MDRLVAGRSRCSSLRCAYRSNVQNTRSYRKANGNISIKVSGRSSLNREQVLCRTHASVFRLLLGPTGSPLLSRSHPGCAADELTPRLAKGEASPDGAAAEWKLVVTHFGSILATLFWFPSTLYLAASG